MAQAVSSDVAVSPLEPCLQVINNLFCYLVSGEHEASSLRGIAKLACVNSGIMRWEKKPQQYLYNYNANQIHRGHQTQENPTKRRVLYKILKPIHLVVSNRYSQQVLALVVVL